jgi:hypothetical protein
MTTKYDSHGEPTNAQRAEWAEATLTAYKSDIKKEGGAADTTDVQDLVSDLLHLMEKKFKSNHKEMVQVFAWAFRRYAEETKKKANSDWAHSVSRWIEAGK